MTIHISHGIMTNRAPLLQPGEALDQMMHDDDGFQPRMLESDTFLIILYLWPPWFSLVLYSILGRRGLEFRHWSLRMQSFLPPSHTHRSRYYSMGVEYFYRQGHLILISAV